MGPFDLTFHDEGLREAEEWTQGIYSARVSIPRDGLWLALVEATPEGASGTLVGGAQFAAGRRYQQPVPGEDAVSVATPTEEDHRGVEPYCTRKPPCAMHGVSLDRALGSGKPTVVIIATPAFCQTRFCGPEVDVVQSVAAELREVDFIHIEVYENDEEAPSRGANGLAPAAAAWKLEEEPVTYFIGSTGKIAGRFLGPAAADEVRAAAQDLT